MARELGIEAPIERHTKQMLTNGRIAIADLTVDLVILKALKPNGDDMVTADERTASTRVHSGSLRSSS